MRSFVYFAFIAVLLCSANARSLSYDDICGSGSVVLPFPNQFDIRGTGSGEGYTYTMNPCGISTSVTCTNVHPKSMFCQIPDSMPPTIFNLGSYDGTQVWTNNTDGSITLALNNGDICYGPSAAQYPREVYITFVCDPNAPIGVGVTYVVEEPVQIPPCVFNTTIKVQCNAQPSSNCINAPNGNCTSTGCNDEVYPFCSANGTQCCLDPPPPQACISAAGNNCQLYGCPSQFPVCNPDNSMCCSGQASANNIMDFTQL